MQQKAREKREGITEAKKSCTEYEFVITKLLGCAEISEIIEKAVNSYKNMPLT